MLAVFFAYSSSVTGGFILDDDRLVYDNDLIKAQNGLSQFWCTAKSDDFWPVTSSGFWIEWRLWDMCPAGYHITNLILHAAEVLLIWVILRRLSIPGAFLAAAIFAVHPVNVESVAWIAQRKNTMAMLFFLLSILWYLKTVMPKASADMIPVMSFPGPLRVAAKQNTAHCPLSTAHCFLWYWLSLAAFVLAMLSKGSVVVLPALLLGIIWWLRPVIIRDIAAHRAVFCGGRGVGGGERVVPDARIRRSAPHGEFYGTIIGRGRSAVVLPLQGIFSARFDLYLSAMANPGRQCAVVAAAFGGICGYGSALAAPHKLEPAAVVCLGIFLRRFTAGNGFYRRGLHEIHTCLGSLSAHSHHWGNCLGLGGLERVASLCAERDKFDGSDPCGCRGGNSRIFDLAAKWALS